MQTVTVQGPARVVHGFDSQAGVYVCRVYETSEQADANRAGPSGLPLCYSFLPAGHSDTYRVSEAGDDAEAAKAADHAALGRWFGDFDTAE